MDVRRAVLAMLVVLVQVHADQVELAVVHATLDDVKSFFAQHYHPGNAIMCVAGVNNPTLSDVACSAV